MTSSVTASAGRSTHGVLHEHHDQRHEHPSAAAKPPSAATMSIVREVLAAQGERRRRARGSPRRWRPRAGQTSAVAAPRSAPRQDDHGRNDTARLSMSKASVPLDLGRRRYAAVAVSGGPPAAFSDLASAAEELGLVRSMSALVLR